MTEKKDDFASMFAASEAARKTPRRRRLTVGETVRGRVVAIDQAAVFVDIGAKSEAMIERAELSDPDTGKSLVEVGDEIEARVVEVDGKAGCPVLRKGAIRGGEGFAALEDAVATGLPVEGKITAVNKGGYDVQLGAVRAFCPISQMDLRPVADPTALVGQRFAFRITRFEDGGRNVVVSRRSLLEDEQRARAEETWKTLQVGSVLKGTVISLQAFGAFVDLGGIEGLVHVSELAHRRIKHPSEVLSVGEVVEVEVTKLERGKDPSDRKATRISLSLRSLEGDPWDKAKDLLVVGRKLAATVVRLESFGAFLELAPGLDGMLHIGELREDPQGKGSSRPLRHAKDVLKVGETRQVVIRELDRERRRIGLGLPTAEDDGPVELPSAPQGFGTFAELLQKAKEKKKR